MPYLAWILLSTLAVAAGHWACESDWEYYQGNCYRYFRHPKTWKDAEGDCGRYQAHLTSIHSEYENDFVHGLAQRANGAYIGDMWIGLRSKNLTRLSPKCVPKWVDGTEFTDLGLFDDASPEEWILRGKACHYVARLNVDDDYTNQYAGLWVITYVGFSKPYVCKKAGRVKELPKPSTDDEDDEDDADEFRH
ncbi:Snaclec bitiscetin subunit alpha [Aphelenchoides avenae]|nr:Snaclec bitiscetin subunit alpha [Aphelenchus avenae]